MRFVIQRVTEATCEVDQKITGQITNGFCVLIGIAETDTKNNGLQRHTRSDLLILSGKLFVKLRFCE